MQCAMTALADSETTQAGDDRLPHTELFLHRHADRRCRVVKVLGDLCRIGRLRIQATATQNECAIGGKDHEHANLVFRICCDKQQLGSARHLDCLGHHMLESGTQGSAKH
jgi:hypothetical protein